MKFVKRLAAIEVRPGSAIFYVAYQIFRWLYEIGLLKNNKKIYFLQTDNSILILVPLAGTSAFREHRHCVFDRLTFSSMSAGRRVYVLSRCYRDRLQSFYNKKVRNPTNIGKLMLLASCASLSYSSSEEEFAKYVASTIDTLEKDKHLWTELQILEYMGIISNQTLRVTCANDAEFLEREFMVDVTHKLNSTRDVASVQSPVNLSCSLFDRFDLY